MIKKKPIPRLKVLIFPLALVVLISGAVFKLNLLTVGQVQIEVNNVGCADERDLVIVSGLTGQNILLINEEDVERKLQNRYPCLKEVKIIRQFGRSLTLKAEGRVSLAKIAGFRPSAPVLLKSLQPGKASSAAMLDWSFPEASQEASLLVVDGTGFIFNQDGAHGLPLVFLADEDLKVGNNPSLAKIAAVFPKLNELGVPVSEAKISDDFLLIQTTPKLAFSLRKDVFRQLASLQLILQEAKINGKVVEFIDLRFDKPVVVYSLK